MPVMKVANKKGTHQNDNARSLLYDYIMQPNKIPHQFVGRESVGDNVVEKMSQTAQHFNKDSRIRVRHFMVSYTPFDTTDPAVVDAIAREVAAYLGQRYQIILARLSQRKAAQKELDGFFHSPIARGSLGNTTSSKLSNGPFFPERESLTYSARSITSLSISFLACAEGRAA